MGFNAKWISWMMECIKTVSLSTLVNGTPSDFFKPTRGIRQGDPLSPYIFIMCAEMLARTLQKNSDLSSSDIGIRIGSGVEKIPFLTFADDTIIFAKASNQSCRTIKSILDKFCTISGQFVNFDKSTFQCTRNIERSLRESFRGILHMNEEAHLGKYLGCPIIDSRVTKTTFESIIQSSRNQLSKWKANSLSQAGRLVLVNANLAAKGTFQMQSFLLPTSIHNRLDKINRDFLWNKNPSQRSPNLIGWHKVCLPKLVGGLGIKSSEVANKALQMKLLWKILMDKESIWVKVITKKYLKNCSLFDHKPNSTSSWQWRKLMSLRPLFRKGLRWQVGDGSNIKFWTDNWVCPHPLSNNLDDDSTCDLNLLVKDFITSDKQWDVSKLSNLVSNDIVNQITNIPLPHNDIPDTLLWGLAVDGNFSTKTATWLAQGLFDQKLEKCDFHWVWNLNIPPKLKFFLWKACVDGLPTKDRLLRSHVDVPPNCLLCNHHMENKDHFFYECPSIVSVIQEMNSTSFNNFLATFDNSANQSFTMKLNSLKDSVLKDDFTKIIFIWWNAWFHRNDIIFNEGHFNRSTLIRLCRNSIKMWDETRHKDLDNPDQDVSSRIIHNEKEIWWEKPEEGFLKLNFDGSKIDGNKAALGYSIRDHNGTVVLLGAKKCGSSSILMAEALALREGILAAKNLGISKLVVEGDNLCVINSIRNTWQIPWEISSIIKDVKLDLHFFDEVIIKHCFREANKVADFMASVGHSCPTLSRWFESRWLQLTSLIRKDEMGWSYPRGST